MLPFEEWPRLEGTLLHPAWQAFDPSTTRIPVVELDGEIVAAVALFQVWHVDGAFCRGGVRAALKVFGMLKRLFLALHISEVCCMELTDEGRVLMRRLGRAAKLDCDHYAVQVLGW